ncbi:MAG: hypothetical protein KDJ37_10795 [Hyphomicrobiaceae bacterium]|nr:hypothetical protein [Hyphomicrobiaceae bacterium]
MNWLKAGAVYFVLTFLAGFAIGPVRELVLKPMVGSTAALAFEAPVMLAIMTWVAARCLKWWRVGETWQAHLGMGAVALLLLLAAEAAFSYWLRQMTPVEWLQHFLEPDGMISLALYLAFAACPLALLAIRKEPGT